MHMVTNIELKNEPEHRKHRCLGPLSEKEIEYLKQKTLEADKIFDEL